MYRISYRCSVGALLVALAANTFADAALEGMGAPSGAISGTSHVERLDPRLDRLLPRDATLERIADGFVWVEGPAWSSREGSLLFSDIPANTIYRWREQAGISTFLSPSGYTGTTPFAGREPGSNGLTFDLDGRLVICEHGDRRITRLEPGDRRTVLAERYQGRRLNSPNDAVYRSNGDLYFTDPPFGLPGHFDDPAKELPWSGVYRLSPDGELTLAIRDIRAPNGLAFSPDERTLYVTDVDPARSAWLAYDVRSDGSLGNGRVFFDATSISGDGRGAPDGMKTDVHGNLFGAGPGGVYVFAPDGTLLGRIVTGVPTSNVAWGEDGATLFVTADTAVHRIRTRTRGARYPG